MPGSKRRLGAALLCLLPLSAACTSGGRDAGGTTTTTAMVTTTTDPAVAASTEVETCGLARIGFTGAVAVAQPPAAVAAHATAERPNSHFYSGTFASKPAFAVVYDASRPRGGMGRGALVVDEQGGHPDPTNHARYGLDPACR